MDGQTVFRWLEQAFGALLVLLVLVDVFLTVLYARAVTGLIGDRVARLTWRVFRWASGPFGRHRATVLSFCGPAILVLLVAVWTGALALGAALIIHPKLGTSVTAASGPTPTDFVSALYAGGSSISIVGAGSFGPTTGAFRLFYLFSSIVGVAGLSLTLTYLMQVYTALLQRNTLGLQVDLAAGQTGDAADLLAGLGPGGAFDRGDSDLANLAAGMAEVKEAHHFYPVLFYYHFRDPYCSVSRIALVSLDTVTLIRSALDDGRYAWLKESAAVAQLGRASMLLVTTLADTFLPDDEPDPRTPPDEQTLDRWRRRYHAGGAGSSRWASRRRPTTKPAPRSTWRCVLAGTATSRRSRHRWSTARRRSIPPAATPPPPASGRSFERGCARLAKMARSPGSWPRSGQRPD